MNQLTAIYVPAPSSEDVLSHTDETVTLTFPASCIPPEVIYLGVSTKDGVRQRAAMFHRYADGEANPS